MSNKKLITLDDLEIFAEGLKTASAADIKSIFKQQQPHNIVIESSGDSAEEYENLGNTTIFEGESATAVIDSVRNLRLIDVQGAEYTYESIYDAYKRSTLIIKLTDCGNGDVHISINCSD